MSLQNKRYYTWLFKAYFKRWKKTIISSILVSVLVSLGIFSLVVFYVTPLLTNNATRIGYWGSYSLEEIPSEIVKPVSMGLVTVNDDGSISPAAAKRWEIKNNIEYTFYLRDDLKFHNDLKFSAKTIPFNFENVKKEVIDDYTIRFTLKDPYAPFLASVSEPILLKDLSGLGQYEIKKIDINAGFVKSINIQDTKKPFEKRVYTFYPTEQALKIAFSLGEIDIAEGVQNTHLNEYDLANWPGVNVESEVNTQVMVTVFFNTGDNALSDKRLRQALHYALPGDIDFGQKLYSPIPESSIYFSKPPNYGISDKLLAKEVLDNAGGPPSEEITVKTTKELETVTKIIVDNWKQIGIKSKIEVVDNLPNQFQVLVYEMRLPRDPDQYILWHSDQRSNIVYYKNLRIDKLLEDGRSVTDVKSRQEIYADFQKYLMDDLPASFFYQPKAYRLLKN